jgi:hypothetical protein
MQPTPRHLEVEISPEDLLQRVGADSDLMYGDKRFHSKLATIEVTSI